MRLTKTLTALLALGLLALAAARVAVADTQRTLTAQSGAVSATLTWTQKNVGAAHVHLTIVRADVTLVDEDLPNLVTARRVQSADGPSPGDTPQHLTVRDLDGNGEPEVIVDLYTNGAHCCFYSRIFRYPDMSGTGYEMTVHEWGDPGYVLKDLDGDGLPEFVSADDRFAYEFTAFAFSGLPIQIWQFRGGDFAPEMQDVTRSFPDQIKKDARRWWNAFLAARRHHEDARGVVAAWAADEYQLNLQDKVATTLQGMVRRHELGGPSGWPREKKYVRALKKFLVDSGYLKLPA